MGSKCQPCVRHSAAPWAAAPRRVLAWRREVRVRAGQFAKFAKFCKFFNSQFNYFFNSILFRNGAKKFGNMLAYLFFSMSTAIMFVTSRKHNQIGKHLSNILRTRRFHRSGNFRLNVCIYLFLINLFKINKFRNQAENLDLLY